MSYEEHPGCTGIQAALPAACVTWRVPPHPHYRLLANPVRRQNLATIRALLHAPAIVDAGDNGSPQGAAPIFASRHCGAPMVNIDILLRSQPIRAPPWSGGNA
jgi:hypothetical protein